jgi:voltage-gated potassium channel
MAAAIGAKRATQLLTRPTAASLLESSKSSYQLNDELGTIGLQMEELNIGAMSQLAGKALDEIEVRGNRGFLIVAVRSSDGAVIMNPAGDLKLKANDTVIVVGHRDDLAALCAAHTIQRQRMTYRGASIS